MDDKKQEDARHAPEHVIPGRLLHIFAAFALAADLNWLIEATYHTTPQMGSSTVFLAALLLLSGNAGVAFRSERAPARSRWAPAPPTTSSAHAARRMPADDEDARDLAALARARCDPLGDMVDSCADGFQLGPASVEACENRAVVVLFVVAARSRVLLPLRLAHREGGSRLLTRDNGSTEAHHQRSQIGCSVDSPRLRSRRCGAASASS